jgi:cysteine sulfinate desulfinase/cysteine desulfurase-like protein
MVKVLRASPNTSFFSLPGLKAETAQIAFDMEGMAVSAGAACSSGKIGEAMGERHACRTGND